VSQRLDLPANVVGAGAGLHADQAARTFASRRAC
jgi:hypothetical protein